MKQRLESLQLLGSGMRLCRVEPQRVAGVALRREHVLGQREHDRPGPPRARGRECTGDELGNAVDLVDLRDPFRHLPEHAPVVQLLERLALLLIGRDLADEQDQRRRVLERRVHAHRRVRRTGPARDDADSRAARELPVGVRHVRGAGLVPAGDEADRRLVEPVEQRDVALARDAERRVGAVHDELVDEQLSAVPAHSVRSRYTRARWSFGLSSSAGST